MMMNPEDVVDLTCKLVRFNTVNPPGNEAALARFIGGLLLDAGFDVQYFSPAPTRTSLVATLTGEAREPLLWFSGHLDTVPVNPDSWQHDPWSASRDGDRLYGRGSTDMKGGVAAMVTAALAVARRRPLRSGLGLIFTWGEETGCEGAAHLVATGALNRRAKALIVGEPTANRLVIGHKGALWLEAEARGKAAHGAMPEQGDNAIYKAARAVLGLERFRFDTAPHPLLGKPTLNVGTIHGGLNVNSVPDQVRIGIDIRTIPGINHDELLSRIGRCLGEEIRLVKTIDAEAVWTEPTEPWVEATARQLASLCGKPMEPETVAYFTDASLLKPALGDPPTILLGPGDPALAHQSDEFCSITQLRQAALIYEQIAATGCCDTAPIKG